MGRGRAKAKQTKVARELKYSSPVTDFDALQREIGNGPPPSRNGEVTPSDDEYADPYAVDEDDEDDTPSRRYR